MSALDLAASGQALLVDIHRALSASETVRESLGDPVRVHDDVPDEPVYPYVTFGDLRSEDRSGDGSPRVAHQISLHLYSRYAGRAEALDVLSRVQGAIETHLGHTVIPLYADVFAAGRGGAVRPNTRHGILRLSIITENET